MVTASSIANAIKEENFDLIFSGLQSDDIGMGQTGIILGEILGMSTASLVMATELSENRIKVKRELEAGFFQWVTMTLPSAPAVNDTIYITDVGGAMGSNPAVVARNGNSIMGLSQSLKVNINNFGFHITWTGTTWRLH